jgi:hypothetical protein
MAPKSKSTSINASSSSSSTKFVLKPNTPAVMHGFMGNPIKSLSELRVKISFRSFAEYKNRPKTGGGPRATAGPSSEDDNIICVEKIVYDKRSKAVPALLEKVLGSGVFKKKGGVLWYRKDRTRALSTTAIRHLASRRTRDGNPTIDKLISIDGVSDSIDDDAPVRKVQKVMLLHTFFRKYCEGCKESEKVDKNEDEKKDSGAEPMKEDDGDEKAAAADVHEPERQEDEHVVADAAIDDVAADNQTNDASEKIDMADDAADEDVADDERVARAITPGAGFDDDVGTYDKDNVVVASPGNDDMDAAAAAADPGVDREEDNDEEDDNSEENERETTTTVDNDNDNATVDTRKSIALAFMNAVVEDGVVPDIGDIKFDDGDMSSFAATTAINGDELGNLERMINSLS